MESKFTVSEMTRMSEKAKEAIQTIRNELEFYEPPVVQMALVSLVAAACFAEGSGDMAEVQRVADNFAKDVRKTIYRMKDLNNEEGDRVHNA